MDGLDAETLAQLERMERERRVMRWLVPLGILAFLGLVGVLAVQLPASTKSDPAPSDPTPASSSVSTDFPTQLDAPILLASTAPTAPVVSAAKPVATSSPTSAPTSAPAASPTPPASGAPKGPDEPLEDTPEALRAQLKRAAAPLVVDATPFEVLLGRAATAGEKAAVSKLSKAARVTWFLAQPALYRAWFDDELEALGLTGAFRPLGRAWLDVPKALAEGTLTPAACVQRLAQSPEFSARYVGGRAFAGAVLNRLLGVEVDDKKARAERNAVMRIYAGQARLFRSKTARGHQALIAVALEDEAFLPAVVRRALQVTGKKIAATRVEAVARAVAERPQALFRARVEEALK